MRYGSSPRPWGMRPLFCLQCILGRFIPTPVGNARLRQSTRPTRSVHPHARGECGKGYVPVEIESGSSPRPWGMLERMVDDLRPVRFIPTPVGNACSPSCLWRCAPVHPHARGECEPIFSGVVFDSGSSPRPWGMLVCNGHRFIARRFIPTPVGNAVPPPGPAPRGAVHPHARGECKASSSPTGSNGGSSPRPWGML